MFDVVPEAVSAIVKDDPRSAVTTSVLLDSAKEDNAVLICEVMMTVVRPDDSALDVWTLPPVSAIAVAVETT